MKNLIILLSLTITFGACKDDPVFDDYREEYLGVYECTKSNRSFDDENFKTDIDDIVIELSETDSIIIFDGTELLIKEDGTTGRILVDGQIYNLTFEGNTFKLHTYPQVIGLAIGCYIIGERK